MGKANEYNAPKHSNSTIHKSNSDGGMSAGVSDGLSATSGMDTDNNTELHINNAASVSGNPRACIGKREAMSVKKNGNSFDVGS